VRENARFSDTRRAKIRCEFVTKTGRAAAAKGRGRKAGRNRVGLPKTGWAGKRDGCEKTAWKKQGCGAGNPAQAAVF
jgi:hypothetical protein